MSDYIMYELSNVCPTWTNGQQPARPIKRIRLDLLIRCWLEEERGFNGGRRTHSGRTIYVDEAVESHEQ